MSVHQSIKIILIATLMLMISTPIGMAQQDTAAHADSRIQLMSIIPNEPPRADKISFSPLNDLGEATVSGEPGAVLPDGHVFLVNLNSSHQVHVRSQPDGSFSTKIFAPPGSNIMVKHGPNHRFWHINPWENIEQGSIGFLTIFPSTTIYRPYEQSTDPSALPFAAVGAVDIDTEAATRTIGAAWSMTGAVNSVTDLHPGDTVQVEATVRLYSQAINDDTDTSTIMLHMPEMTRWLMLYNNEGTPLPYENLAGSSRLTSGGFPILDSKRPEVFSQLEMQPVNWEIVNGNVIEGHLTLDLILGENMPPGIYRPILRLEVTGVPTGSEWRAALTSWMAGVASVTYDSSGLALPPVTVNASADSQSDSNQSQRLIWYLQMDHASLGTRGAGAIEDRNLYQPASFVATQGAPYVLSPTDPYTGEPATYRLEPYLPMISYGRGAAPSPPLLPFRLPGGELCVTIHEPDENINDLGCDTFTQSVSGDRSTAKGELLNFGSIEISEYYGLTTNNENFEVSFTKTGYHTIEMTGWVEDVWGNRYEGGGTYEVWVAHPIDIDPGLLPGTPLAVGDTVNPTLQLNPRLPAYVNLVFRHFPHSDPDQMQLHVIEGWANRFGYFATDDPPITVDQPGEYRLDLFAEYFDPTTGESYAGAATWGGIVMTPSDEAQLIAHGRRGSDNVLEIPNQWFVFCDMELLPGGTPHLLNPYLNGDILWSYNSIPPREGATPECLGDALIMNASVQDTVGTVETAITERFHRSGLPAAFPGSFEDRVQVDALPLFSSTTSGRPPSIVPGEIDQIAYAYLSSQRPGVRVREAVAEDWHSSGYWRVDGMYDNQLGVGVEGDLPNDFKFQYVGAVYRDLESGLNEYLGQGSGWVHLPYDDTVGSRVMPPFSGPGNGGWPTTGGPLMTIKGQDIHMFIMPTGVRPGTVLQVGDRFDFAGHLMPTLDSQVEVEVTAPSGQTRVVSGQANHIGYFYAPADSFMIDEPGLWRANVRVWHDGQIGSGEQVNCDPADPFNSQRPCPSGDILGSTDGSYSFYVVPADSPRLELTMPAPGRLTFGSEVTPINISGPIPPDVNNATVDYTISIPGFILEQGQAQVANGTFSLTFDPTRLNADFPNLDLTGRYTMEPGLSDTFSVGILLTGEQGEEQVYSATTLTIQGDQVYVENALDVQLPDTIE